MKKANNRNKDHLTMKVDEMFRRDLPPDVAEKAIANVLNEWKYFPTARWKVSEEILSRFAWHESPEGHEFWRNIHDQLVSQGK